MWTCLGIRLVIGVLGALRASRDESGNMVAPARSRLRGLSTDPPPLVSVQVADATQSTASLFAASHSFTERVAGMYGTGDDACSQESAAISLRVLVAHEVPASVIATCRRERGGGRLAGVCSVKWRAGGEQSCLTRTPVPMTGPTEPVPVLVHRRQRARSIALARPASPLHIDPLALVDRGAPHHHPYYPHRPASSRTLGSVHVPPTPLPCAAVAWSGVKPAVKRTLAAVSAAQPPLCDSFMFFLEAPRQH
ncbi:hypothetical protein GGTG_08879 [Gaeumannomyces tritici R3-111a-1]|uniref:Secreted protein n=1 Tax=Gaeumannomyces tritici (strain R3-111a-1) TaxID=644352 RepID=J3P5T9_GAET3|nr:hypothetical protein GGTG_08879 [Gaeumannomyces tritici R3-111a-1]EJT75041.1 hypothetical protein GGTG_08879 [Gaeumannomyces tritici R3-111a-1]